MATTIEIGARTKAKESSLASPLQKELGGLADKMSRHIYAMRELEERGDKAIMPVLREWKKTVREPKDTIATWNPMLGKAANRIAQAKEANPECNFYEEDRFLNCVETAGCLLILDCTKKLRKSAERLGLPDLYAQYVDLEEFDKAAPGILRIGSYSIYDLLNRTNLSLPEVFRTLMEADVLRINPKPVDKNQTEITLAFPNITKEAIRTTAEYLRGLNGTSPDSFRELAKELIPNRSQAEERFITKALFAITRLAGLRNDFLTIILHPDSKEFPALRDLALTYLTNRDINVRRLSVVRLGIENPEQLRMTYRTAEKMSKLKNGNSSFFKALEKAIKELTETTVQMHTLTKDDFPFLIRGNQNDTVDPPTFEHLKELAKTMPPDTRHPIDPDAIEWCSLKKPAGALLRFYEGSPTGFTINLEYKRENGDSLIVILGFATAKKENQLDWNFLEDPNDPEMKALRNSAMLAAQNILSAAKKRVEDARLEKLRRKAERMAAEKLRNAELSPQAQKPEKRERIPREKIKKDRPQKPQSVIEAEILQSRIPTAIKEETKICIDIPENWEGARPKNIPQEQWQKLGEKIKRFNQNNKAGNIKLLSKTGSNKRIFRLTVVKKLRVLVTEIPTNGNGDGTQHYAIEMVVKRNNEYREI